ncbi:MAG: hypothetical protein V3W14_01945 [Candidatus Neomarinimicrobiota bacterium]
MGREPIVTDPTYLAGSKQPPRLDWDTSMPIFPVITYKYVV